MASIKKPGPYNPQKAEAYVGKKVLKNGDTIPAIKGSISPVPNGPLVQKKGQFKGSTLKNGGSTPAWQRKEGKSLSGGLNAKGRASLKAAGHDIKAPQPEGGPRKKSFCARMSGMKSKLTSAKTANDPNSRINKSLHKWKC
jgi:hypothetical protein